MMGTEISCPSSQGTAAPSLFLTQQLMPRVFCDKGDGRGDLLKEIELSFLQSLPRATQPCDQPGGAQGLCCWTPQGPWNRSWLAV